MEKLHLQIDVKPEGKLGGRSIRVGNTGFVVWQHAGSPTEGHVDYFPEGHWDAFPGKARQYALTFLGAMNDFCEWNQAQYTPIATLAGTTNHRMSEFVLRNFQPAAQVTSKSNLQPHLEIDLQKVLKDQNIVQNLYSARNQLLSEEFTVK